MITRLLPLLLAVTISACNAETQTTSAEQLSPKLQAEIAKLNEAREMQIKKIKAMHLSPESEEKYIAELNKEVDGVIAGFVMQEEMQRTPEEIASSNKRARDQYEKIFGTKEEQEERFRQDQQAIIDAHNREEARRRERLEQQFEERLRAEEKADQARQEHLERMEALKAQQAQRQSSVNQNLEEFNRKRQASMERMLKVKEEAERRRQQSNHF